MFPVPEPFGARDEADVLRLVTEHPLAWVVAGDGLSATPLPVRPLLDAGGRLTGLISHLARRNPQLEVMRATPRATLLFMGPQGYISPSWISRRTWGPTWNYASAAFDCSLEFFDDAEGLRALLDDLAGSLEAGRENAWSVEEMGPRYDQLSKAIVGFRATILDRRAVFKLGQDESDAEFAEILTGLGEGPLSDWMRGFRPS
jgi:predicted FMN-binding regulatory protein PaiB